MNSSTTKWCVSVALVATCVTAGLRGAAADLPEMDGVPTAEAETVGMSSERLDRIDGVMGRAENARQKQPFQGMMVSVFWFR